ncbi:MAG: AraC family transcriptional regulator [Bacteroidia bacterium]|nr:AraC family transcriptional regulator [Bacteroidia bacterium]
MQYLIPRLKKVEPDLGSSLRYSRFTQRAPDAKAYWHYHPEVELVYIKEGFGNRYVGNHISKFEDGDLILMGPDIPHFGYEFGLQGVNEEIVVQFKKDLIKSSVQIMPELEKIDGLINKSKSGISFYGKTKVTIGKELELMESQDPFDRLLSILKVLQILSESTESEVLNAAGMTLIIQNQDDDRINQVYNYVKEYYQSEISLDQISQVASMTVPAFCRYFKKYTKKTFTQFVNEFRVRQAIRLISLGSKSITEISFEVGFNNFSHFNKQFKRVTGVAPSVYKKSMYQIID